MDLGELLNFHPNRANKRPFEDITPSPSHKQPRRSHKYPPTPAHSLGKSVPISESATSVPHPVASQEKEEAPVEEKRGNYIHSPLYSDSSSSVFFSIKSVFFSSIKPLLMTGNFYYA